MLNKRKEKIVLYLSNKSDFVTADELARVVNTSTKTVYRIITELNQESENGELIYSQRGSGYKLNYDIFVEKDSQYISRDGFSATERRNEIMIELLMISPRTKNIYDLFHNYYVGNSVISSDIKIISDLLGPYNLDIINQNNHLSIVGEEQNIRQALSKFRQSQSDNDVRLNTYDAEFVDKQISYMEKTLNIKFPHPYDDNIFSHLYIMIRRYRNSGLVIKEKSKIAPKDNKVIINELWSVSKQVIENTQMYLGVELLDDEILYLYQYLISSRMQDEDEGDTFFEIDPTVKQIVDYYIASIERKLDKCLFSKSLENKLAKHVQPMLNRLNNGILIKNNLLEQIKFEYKEIFEVVTKTSKELIENKLLTEITDDENGYITLYFAQAIESISKKVKAVVMCTTGVGTSELIKVKIQRQFPEIEILDVISDRDIENVSKDIDVIIATFNPHRKFNVPVIVISAMFTRNDSRRVQEFIDNYEE